MKTAIQVAGMSCEGCAQSVVSAVAAVGGQAHVNLATGQVIVDYDNEKVSLDKIKTAITDAGYDVCS